MATWAEKEARKIKKISRLESVYTGRKDKNGLKIYSDSVIYNPVGENDNWVEVWLLDDYVLEEMLNKGYMQLIKHVSQRNYRHEL